MDSIYNDLADPESLLGMLQRGRGKGYLAALEAAPEAVWPLLLDCVTNDPRLDRVCEEREEYYAALIVATRMDLEPFRSHLGRHDVGDDVPDWAMGLVLCTLGCLAEEKRSTAALRILREYVSYGRKWKRVLQVLAEVETPAALEQTVAVLCRRIARDPGIRAQFDHEVQEDWKSYCRHDEAGRAEISFFLPICEPWKTICERNREFRDLFAGVGIAYDRPPAPEERPKPFDPGDLSLKESYSHR